MAAISTATVIACKMICQEASRRGYLLGKARAGYGIRGFYFIWKNPAGQLLECQPQSTLKGALLQACADLLSWEPEFAEFSVDQGGNRG